jgi:hypothetical protein
VTPSGDSSRPTHAWSQSGPGGATRCRGGASHLRGNRRAIPAPHGSTAMEIAAVVLMSSVVLYFCQQFDEPTF